MEKKRQEKKGLSLARLYAQGKKKPATNKYGLPIAPRSPIPIVKQELDPREAYKQNKQYIALPDNVKQAIDKAQSKAAHSDFYYRLQTLNDKIYVFRNVFYTKVPSYQKAFYEKKRQALEEKLNKQKLQFEKEMKDIQLKLHAKPRSSNLISFGGVR